jgi:hypothetical protein
MRIYCKGFTKNEVTKTLGVFYVSVSWRALQLFTNGGFFIRPKVMGSGLFNIFIDVC